MVWTIKYFGVLNSYFHILYNLVDNATYPVVVVDYLEYFFPKDKVIFLMCGGGAYAGNMKKMLVKLGWDKDKIYNIGGFWYYNGKNEVKVKRVEKNKEIYDFWKVDYHDIDFNSLTEVKKWKNIQYQY